MDDLNLSLEFVNLSLHELLSDLSEELKVEFYEATFHDLLAELDGLLLAVFDDFPELVRKRICALVQLLLGLIVLSQVWILVRELVKALNVLIKNVLLAITGVQELQELHLEARVSDAGLFSLQANVSENALHLALVVLGKVSP